MIEDRGKEEKGTRVSTPLWKENDQQKQLTIERRERIAYLE